MPLSNLKVTMAVAPSVAGAFLKHMVQWSKHRNSPSADLSYHLSLEFVKSYIKFANRHTVEAVQNYGGREPATTSSKQIITTTTIEKKHLDRAADLIAAQLGQDGIREIGGQEWWQWRGQENPLVAEWIENKTLNVTRKTGSNKRVIIYFHGGAYYMGSTSQMRNLIKKLSDESQNSVFAVSYRLAPQFPFPCALQDSLAAYLTMLDIRDPSNIQFWADAAGAGLALSALCLLRDQGVPLPNAVILLSPYVDMTSSFPSITGDEAADYMPETGFLHKTSMVWPPLDSDDFEKMIAISPHKAEAKYLPERIPDIFVAGKMFQLKRQIHMYCPNSLLTHPHVSPLFQISLGGLPPVLIQSGGAELLRDEHVYLACKLANPTKYAPGQMHKEYRHFVNPAYSEEEQAGRLADWDERLNRYGPTECKLQIFDRACHFAQAFTWTNLAKRMYGEANKFSIEMFNRDCHGAKPPGSAVDSAMPSASSMVWSIESSTGTTRPAFSEDQSTDGRPASSNRMMPNVELFQHPYTTHPVDPTGDEKMRIRYLSPMDIPADMIGKSAGSASLQAWLTGTTADLTKKSTIHDNQLRFSIMSQIASGRLYWHPFKNSDGEFEVPPLTALVARKPRHA